MIKIVVGFLVGCAAAGAVAIVVIDRGDDSPRNATTTKSAAQLDKLLAPIRKKLQKESDKTAITFRQYLTVRLGQSVDHIEGRFGPPESSSCALPEPDETCVSYGYKGRASGLFIFYFNTKGKLVAKDQTN